MRIVAILIVPGDPRPWLPCVLSLIEQTEVERVVVGTTDVPAAQAALAVTADVICVGRLDAADLIGHVREENTEVALLIVWAPVIAPARLFAGCPELLADLRVGTISFLSNAAGYISFPFWNQQRNHQLDDLDETMVNDRLRGIGPMIGAVPIPVAAGPAVLITSVALDLVGPGYGGVHPAVHLADISLSGGRRGLVSLLDTTTFVARPSDLGVIDPDPLSDPGNHPWLVTRHPFFSAAYSESISDAAAPLRIGHQVAVAKVRGLRVLIDGTCLGPKEMGTQVQTLSLIAGLLLRDDVRSVCVALPGEIPPYAAATLGQPKIQVLVSPTANFVGVEPADILHRPFQPDRELPIDQWRTVASRIVVTVQDLIGFEIGSYHADGSTWMQYRAALRAAVKAVDGVVVISGDALAQVERQRLSIDPGRLFVVPNGTDHLVGDEDTRIPVELARRGLVANPFLLVLGANYSHKNRDVAIGIWRELRARGFSHQLVMVGAAVPFGSSRWEEAQVLESSMHDQLFSVPDVDSAGRNWLLKHADLVLYPTAAEGFGLVPFEAARFGTPTVSVRFGPLAEVSPDNPSVASD